MADEKLKKAGTPDSQPQGGPLSEDQLDQVSGGNERAPVPPPPPPHTPTHHG